MTKENTTYSIIHKITTGILIPIVFYLLSQINTLNKDLTDFKVEIASEYVKTEAIVRIEQKLDDIRNLVYQEIKGEQK